MLYRLRFLHWFWASIRGYFWLPCPICGNNFGGHEYSGSLDYSDFTGEGVCPRCAEEAKRRNKIRREKQDSEGFWVMNERDGSMRFQNREEYIGRSIK
jgi:ribosome-binding protein aMBF1 (putative translation factor)